MEQLMVDRLVEMLPPEVRVFSAADLAGVLANSQVAPAVHVIFGGPRVLEVKHDRRSAKVMQIWYAVPVVRNVANQIDGKGARVSASAVIDQTLEVLMGWKASDAFSELKLETPPPPRWIKGLGYHPLAFSTNTAVGTTSPRP